MAYLGPRIAPAARARRRGFLGLSGLKNARLGDLPANWQLATAPPDPAAFGGFPLGVVFWDAGFRCQSITQVGDAATFAALWSALHVPNGTRMADIFHVGFGAAPAWPASQLSDPTCTGATSSSSSSSASSGTGVQAAQQAGIQPLKLPASDVEGAAMAASAAAASSQPAGATSGILATIQSLPWWAWLLVAGGAYWLLTQEG